MSEELSYKVSVEGVKDLDALAGTIDKVNNVLRAGSGAGKSLEEMRKILVGMKGQASIIDQLRAAVVGLNKSSTGLKKSFVDELTGLKSTMINELRSIQGAISTSGFAAGASFNDGIVDGMRASTKKVSAEADEAVAAIKKAQKQVAAATNATTAQYTMYNPNSGLKGSPVVPRSTSAPTMTVDDVRYMLGMPDRARMADFASQLKKQMQEEVAKATLKGRSATPMGLEDTRAMLGLPDRAGMSTFAAQLKAQMAEDLAKTKLRGASATPVSLEDTRAMLGLPSRAEMSSFASSLKAQMQEELSKSRLRGRSATPLNMEDTRAMLGAPSRAEMSTFAAQLKAQMQEELARAKLKAGSATPMGMEDTRAMLGLPSRAEMKSLAAQIKAQMQEEMNLAKYQQKGSALGMSAGTVGGAFSEFNAVKLNAQAAKAELDKLTAGNNFGKMSTDIKKLNTDMGDTHSLARGLASGFDLLWLTWGKLAPLFTGAAISFGVRKTFDIGAEVEYNIKMMEMLGQSTKEQSPIIRQALRDIDQTTQFSLLDLSKNLVVLGQAGLSVKDSLQMLRPTADLASLGQVNLKTSTDLLIQSMALFGKTSADAGQIAAQIFEATKTGVLNVEDIAGSLKYASEVNTRFGKSLDETLVVLNALAQGGIKASSGGTAFINFLRDLNGRTPKATKALADLSKQTGVSLDAFNKDGSQKSVLELIKQLGEATKQLHPKDVDKFLGAFFTARGGRTWYTAIREGNIELEKLQQQIAGASPEAFMQSAKGLMDTSKGALDVMKGAMVGALDTTFEKYSEGFKRSIMDATAVLNSAEFQGTLNTMVGGVMSLYDSLKTLWPVIKTTAEAFVIFKAATVGMSVFQSLAAGVAALGARYAGLQVIMGTTGGAAAALTGAISTNGAAMIGQQAAAQASAAGQGRLQAAMVGTSTTAAATTGVLRGFSVVAGFLANPLVGIAIALGLVGATFYTTAKAAQEHAATFTDAVVTNGKVNLSQWDKEILKLQQRNSLMAGGNALGRYAEQMDVIKAKDAEIDKARKDMQRSQQQYQESYAKDPKGMLLPVQRAQVDRDTKVYMQQLAQREKMQKDVKALVDKEQADEDAAAKKAMERQKKMMADVMGNPNVPENPAGGTGKPRRGGPADKYYDAVEARAKNAADYAKAMWQEMYNAGEMSATEYYDNLSQLNNRETDSVIEAMRRQIAAGKDVEQAQVAIEKAEQDRTIKSVQLNNQRVAALSREEYSLEAVRLRLANMAKEGAANSAADLFSIGHGDKEAARLKELADLSRQYDAERARVAQNLAKQVDKKDYAKLAEEAETAYKDIGVAEENRKAAAIANWAIMDQAQQSWLSGANKAWENYAAEANNKAGLMSSVMGTMFRGFEDMLVKFTTTGKLAFGDFASSVITEIIRMEAKTVTSSIFGLLGGAGGFGGMLKSVGSFLFNAKGNVYNSPSLSQYSNGVYNKPTMFAFAKGAGVFGEAGPEAIMPLTRASGGDLGVKMVGGGMGGAPQIHIESNVYIDSNGTARASTNVQGGNGGNFDAMARELTSMMQGQIEKETRHNGIIWRAVNGY